MLNERMGIKQQRAACIEKPSVYKSNMGSLDLIRYRLSRILLKKLPGEMIETPALTEIQ
jgi:hypothetical protein